jgi:hypothetical protein
VNYPGEGISLLCRGFAFRNKQSVKGANYMAEYGNPNDRMKEITDRLEEGKQFYSHHENNLLGS